MILLSCINRIFKFLLFVQLVSMSRAIVYEPTGSNDTPLKYTAGLVLAVPVDCDLFNVRDICLVRVAIRTPDQKVRSVEKCCNKVVREPYRFYPTIYNHSNFLENILSL